MRVALLFAVPQEIQPLLRRAGSTLSKATVIPGQPSYTGRIGAAEVCALAGGIGRKRAGAAAEVILEHWSPDLLLMTGVAGALHPDLAVGDLVIADEVLTETGNFSPTRLYFAHRSGKQQPRVGGLLSLDRVLLTAAEKHAAYERRWSDCWNAPSGRTRITAPLAVEMETAAVAERAKGRGVPWAALRAVSDSASEALPLDFNRLRNEAGDLPISRIALAAIARPGAIPGLLRLGRNTSLAATALAEFLIGWLEALPAGGFRGR